MCPICKSEEFEENVKLENRKYVNELNNKDVLIITVFKVKCKKCGTEYEVRFNKEYIDKKIL